MRMDVTERFWDKVEKTETCWLWTAATNARGYGKFRLSNPRRLVYAHRFAYELLVGPIPDGLDIDHVRARGCTHRNCVNPAHLEPVTMAENLRRGDSGKAGAAFQREKTHCPRGHAYDEANTGRYRGTRYCRECKREAAKGDTTGAERQRRYRERLSAAASGGEGSGRATSGS